MNIPTKDSDKLYERPNISIPIVVSVELWLSEFRKGDYKEVYITTSRVIIVKKNSYDVVFNYIEQKYE